MKKKIFLLLLLAMLTSCCQQNKSGIIKTEYGFEHHGFSINKSQLTYFANGFRKKVAIDSLNFSLIKDISKKVSDYSLNSFLFNDFVKSKERFVFSSYKNNEGDYLQSINKYSLLFMPKLKVIEKLYNLLKNASKLNNEEKLDFLSMFYINSQNNFSNKAFISLAKSSKNLFEIAKINPKVKIFNASTKKQYTAIIKLVSINGKNKYSKYAKALKLFFDDKQSDMLIIFYLVK